MIIKNGYVLYLIVSNILENDNKEERDVIFSSSSSFCKEFVNKM